MNSLGKMLEVLILFTPTESVLTADEIIARMGYTRPTAYRYFRQLCAAGLLRRFAGGYSLGPRIIELDYVIRQSDPLLKVASGTMKGLADRYGCEVVLLSMYGERVITVHEEKGSESPPVSFGRGRPVPLFRGAGSKLIAAFQSSTRQKRLFELFPQDVAASRLGNDWETFRTSLRKIRAAGSALSMGELDPANVGVSAPVFDIEGDITGALVLVLSEARYQIADKSLLVETLASAAAHITQRIASQGSVDEFGLPLPAPSDSKKAGATAAETPKAGRGGQRTRV